MPRTRRVNGGSGFRLPSSAVKTLVKTNKNKNKNKNKKTPVLPTRRPASHANLTNANLENLHVVNTNTPEWRVAPGNGNTHVPKNLRYVPTMKYSNTGPGVRVFHTGIRPEQVPNW